MKRRLFCLLVLMMVAFPLCAGASLNLEAFEMFKKDHDPQSQLHFPETSNAQWENRSGNQLGFRCQLLNDGTSKTVAYELYVYTEDVWGERLLPEDEVYTYTVKKAIEPDQVRYTDYILIPDRSDIYKVYVAVKKVRFENDKIIEFDNPTYYNWTIK